MKTSQDLWNRANEIRNGIVLQFPQLQAMRIVIKRGMGQRAGKARPEENCIWLSYDLFSQDKNFDESFFNTVTHEIAHILVPPTARGFGSVRRTIHGWQWEAMHRKLGGTGERCHKMETVSCERQARLVPVACPKCSQPIMLSPVRARRAATGTKYFHRICPTRSA